MSIRREALSHPGLLSHPPSLPARRKSVSYSLFRPLPLRPSQSPRQLPVPSQPLPGTSSPCCRLPRILPGHFPPRRSSGAPHASVSFRAPLPQGAAALRLLPALGISPPCPSVLPLPGESPALRPGPFHHAVLSTPCARPRPSAPSGTLRSRGRTNPFRKGCDAPAPGFSLKVPPAPSGRFPEFPRSAPLRCLYPPCPFPGGSFSCRLPRPAARPWQKAPESRKRTRRSPGTPLSR